VSAVAETSSIATASVAVELRGVSVRFMSERSEVTALENISFTLAEGGFLTLLGPSGCGKSTLLRVVADIIAPSSGQVLVLGAAPGEARRRRDIGFVFQDSTLLPWRDALDNVRLPLQVGGGARKRRAGRSPEELLALVGLSGWEHAMPHELSGGMRQRVAIARALLGDPRILLMDEPFGPLDAQTRQIMGNLLLDLWSADRKAVLFVTHDLEEAIALADRVVIMSAGPASRIIGDWKVALARPRDIAEVKLEKAFQDLHREIWAVLKAEVLKGYAQTSG